jgi:hypothetical protein
MKKVWKVAKLTAVGDAKRDHGPQANAKVWTPANERFNT